jgi:HEAT repeat protein
MEGTDRIERRIRLLLSITLAVLSLTMTWAWGQVARLADTPATEAEPQRAALYAAWRPAGADGVVLFRSVDQGASWQPLALPQDLTPKLWAADGGEQIAVVGQDDSVWRSRDRGETWSKVAEDLSVRSLAWNEVGGLYLGLAEGGVSYLSASGSLSASGPAPEELASAPIVGLSLAGGRLFAATPSALFHTDNGGRTWAAAAPIPELATTIVATSPQVVYAGTATAGVYKSLDAGQTWRPALEGLGLAAGQMVRITALQADPEESGVLYATVDHLVGSTRVHASAAGAFVTLDGGSSWEPLAGPVFPDARQAFALLVAGGKPLYVQAVTAAGLQAYEPDLAGAMETLEHPEAQKRASAARTLGLAGHQGAEEILLAALCDPDPGVSLAAAEALGRINDPAAASGLLIALEHPSERVRGNAARAAGMMGLEAAVKPLRSMLLSGEGPEVSMAAEALSRIGSPAAIDALLAALSDSRPTPRWHAAMAGLESLGQPAVAPLAAMLESQEAHVRSNAVQALGWIGSPSATEALVSRLKDRDAGVRTQAAWALGEIGDPAAQTALERAVAQDTAVQVRDQAEWALSRIEQKPAATAGWLGAWAPTLSQLEALRWLLLGLSLAGAMWLAMGPARLSPIWLFERHNHR